MRLTWLLLCAAALCSTVSANELEAVSHKLTEIRQQHGLAALAAVIVTREKIILEHYSGVEDWDSGNPVTSATWFRAGSVTKVFTGLALLRAEEMGLVRLDQPVSAQLAGGDLEFAFDNPYHARAPLVLADLAEHTAGWFDMSAVEFDDKDPAPRTLEQALRVSPASRISHWQPGQFYSYSNSGPGLAALVVERASGQDFDEWIRTRVFEPLGMHATLLWAPHIEERRATGYDSDYRTPIPYWHIIFRPSGGMNLRPVEMERFLRMMLNDGVVDGKQVFSTAQLQRLTTPTRTLAARAGLNHGYGLGIYHSLRNGHTLYMHGGDADGYLSHFAISPESGLAYFLVINAFNHEPLKAMRKVLDAYLVDGLPEITPPPLLRIPEPYLRRIEGRYALASTRFPAPEWEQQTIQVSRNADGGISISLTSRSQALKATRVTSRSIELRRLQDPVATRAILMLDDGRTVYQDSRSSWVKQNSTSAGSGDSSNSIADR